MPVYGEDFQQMIRRTLGGIGVFRGVAEDLLLEVGERCRWCAYPANHTLVRFGDEVDEVHALISGAAHIRCDDGRAEGLLRQGSMIMLQAAFRRGPSRLHIVTTAPVEIAVIPCDVLLEAMTRSQALFANVGRLLAARVLIDDERAYFDALEHRFLQALACTVHSRRRYQGETVRVIADIDMSLWSTLLGVDVYDLGHLVGTLVAKGVVAERPAGGLVVDVGRLRQHLA